MAPLSLQARVSLDLYLQRQGFSLTNKYLFVTNSVALFLHQIRSRLWTWTHNVKLWEKNFHSGCILVAACKHFIPAISSSPNNSLHHILLPFLSFMHSYNLFCVAALSLIHSGTSHHSVLMQRTPASRQLIMCNAPQRGKEIWHRRRFAHDGKIIINDSNFQHSLVVLDLCNINLLMLQQSTVQKQKKKKTKHKKKEPFKVKL